MVKKPNLSGRICRNLLFSFVFWRFCPFPINGVVDQMASVDLTHLVFNTEFWFDSVQRYYSSTSTKLVALELDTPSSKSANMGVFVGDFLYWGSVQWMLSQEKKYVC